MRLWLVLTLILLLAAMGAATQPDPPTVVIVYGPENAVTLHWSPSAR